MRLNADSGPLHVEITDIWTETRLIDSYYFNIASHPFRWEIDPAAISTLPYFFVNNFFAIDLKFNAFIEHHRGGVVSLFSLIHFHPPYDLGPDPTNKRHHLIKAFSEMKEIASLKPQSLEKGELIRVVPSHGCKNILNTLLPVVLEYCLGQSFSDTLSHKFWINPKHADPGALIHAKAPGSNRAEHVAYNPSLEFGNEAGITPSFRSFFDDAP